jgi:hypothetical protein
MLLLCLDGITPFCFKSSIGSHEGWLPNALTNQLFNRPTNSICWVCSRNREIQERQSYGYVHSAHWRYMGVVNMTLRPHYPAKEPLCPLNGRLGEPQGPSGLFGKETSPLTPAVVRTPDRPTCNLVAIPFTQFRLTIITKYNPFISMLNCITTHNTLPINDSVWRASGLCNYWVLWQHFLQ